VFRARVLARTLLFVFLGTSTFFRWFFSNYVQDYLKDNNIPSYSVRKYESTSVQRYSRK
jgi:hypothetical protein